MSDGQADGVEARYATARILFTAIALSPLLFVAVLWLFVGRTELPGPPGLEAWIVWGLLGGSGLVLCLLFRRRTVAAMEERSRRERSAEGFTVSTLQGHLVIAWAGAEVVGFAGGIAYFFLDGSLTMLATALAASVLGFGLSAPRKAWYRTLEREAAAARAG